MTEVTEEDIYFVKEVEVFCSLKSIFLGVKHNDKLLYGVVVIIATEISSHQGTTIAGFSLDQCLVDTTRGSSLFISILYIIC